MSSLLRYCRELSYDPRQLCIFFLKHDITRHTTQSSGPVLFTAAVERPRYDRTSVRFLQSSQDPALSLANCTQPYKMQCLSLTAVPPAPRGTNRACRTSSINKTGYPYRRGLLEHMRHILASQLMVRLIIRSVVGDGGGARLRPWQATQTRLQLKPSNATARLDAPQHPNNRTAVHVFSILQPPLPKAVTAKHGKRG